MADRSQARHGALTGDLPLVEQRVEVVARLCLRVVAGLIPHSEQVVEPVRRVAERVGARDPELLKGLLVLRLRGVDDVRRGLRELVLELLRDRAWKASSELLREILALLLGVVANECLHRADETADQRAGNDSLRAEHRADTGTDRRVPADRADRPADSTMDRSADPVRDKRPDPTDREALHRAAQRRPEPRPYARDQPGTHARLNRRSLAPTDFHASREDRINTTYSAPLRSASVGRGGVHRRLSLLL